MTTTDGEHRRDNAHRKLTGKHQSFVRRAQRMLLEMILRCGEATADDLRAEIDIPVGMTPNVMGAVPVGLAAAGIIACCGYRKSKRAIAHAHPNAIWRIINQAKADAWLRQNEGPGE